MLNIPNRIYKLIHGYFQKSRLIAPAKIFFYENILIFFWVILCCHLSLSKFFLNLNYKAHVISFSFLQQKIHSFKNKMALYKQLNIRLILVNSIMSFREEIRFPSNYVEFHHIKKVKNFMFDLYD